MALVYMTGFEIQSGTTYLTSEGWTLNASSGLTTFAGRTGGTAVGYTSNFGSGSSSLNHSFDRTISGTTVVVGFGFFNNWTNTDLLMTNNTQFLQIRSGTTVVGMIRCVNVGGARKIQVINSAVNQSATSTTTFANNSWIYIEAKWVMSTTVGSLTLRINGVQEAQTSGINTGSTVPNNVLIQGLNTGASQFQDSRWDDIYVLDGSGTTNNDFLGDQKIILLNPTGAGSNTDWTPSTGSNFQVVDENLGNSDTDYITSSVANNIDTYTLEDLPATSSEVFGLKSIIQARKTDVQTRQIAPVIRIGVTDHAGTSSAGLSTSYAHYTQLYDQDPTSADWDVSKVNNIELGVKHVT